VGSVNDIWEIFAGEKIVLELNLSGMPVCTNGRKFGRLGGKYVRSEKFVGLSPSH
jgi:hypothetical protein